MAQTDRLTGLVGNAAFKVPCMAATTGPITLSGEQTIDGLACTTDMRVLVKDQVDGTTNGIYVVDTGAWSLAKDADGVYDWVEGSLVPVLNGTQYKYFELVTSDPVVAGTSDMVFMASLVNSAALIEFLAEGTSAAPRSIQDKLLDNISLLDFIPNDDVPHDTIRDGTNTTDLSGYVMAAIDSVLEGQTIEVPNGTYLMNSDVINFAKIVNFVSTSSGVLSNSQSRPSVRFKANTSGAFFWKFSNLQTDLSLLRLGMLFNGIAVDLNSKTFTDAGVVFEGLSSLRAFGSSIIRGTGAALRLREVFEPYFHSFGLHNHDASGASGVVVIDNVYNATATHNVNNFRFHLGHVESNQGPLFFAHESSNLDIFEVMGTKFEFGLLAPPSGGPWSVFEIRNGFRINIHDNSFALFKNSNKYDTLFEMGYASNDATATFSIHDNDFTAVDASTVGLRTLGNARGEFFNQTCVGSSSILPTFDLQARTPSRIEPFRNFDTSTATVGTDNLKKNLPIVARNGVAGLVSVHDLSPSLGASSALPNYIADANALNVQGSAFKSGNAASQALIAIPLNLFSGFPGSIRVGVRCRSETGAGSVLLAVGTTNFATKAAPVAYDTIWWDIPIRHFKTLGASGSDRFRVSTGGSNAEAVYLDGFYFQPAEFLPNCTVRHFDDFLGDVLADQWGSAVGSDPQCVAPAALAGISRGVVRMTTGDDAAATMAVNGVQLVSAAQWQTSNGGLVFEARARISAITLAQFFVGLTDTLALEAPFTLAAGDVLTATASDAVGFLFDTAADTDTWWLVGGANNVAATKQNTGLSPAASTNETFRIEMTAAGVATFYRNGSQIGTAMTGAVTAATLLTPYVGGFSRTTATRLIDCDYVLIETDR